MSDHDETGLQPAADGWDLMADLADAVERGDAQAVAALLRAGADPEEVTELEGPTVLMHAAEAGNLDVVRALVEGGANVNAAASEDDLYRFLDADEADVFQSGVSALLYAALKGHRAVYDYLYPLTHPVLRREVERATEALGRLRKPAQRDRRPL
jgi:ankyrin repeat protein